MKKIVLFFLIGSFMLLLMACEVKDPSQPRYNVTLQQLILKKIVAIGNSLTAGFQSAGMVRDFQEHSYPYYIAMQMGIASDFQMPWIESPGIGTTSTGDPTRVATPLSFDPATGSLEFTTYPATQVPGLLSNVFLQRPYDNLAVPGADAKDMLEATTSASSSNPANPFFDIILRNPNFGNMTMLEQAKLLNPTLILLWIGNNDVLGAALDGGDPNQITAQADFTSRLTSILTDLRTNTKAQIVMANIPYVTDIPYVNTLDIIFHDSPAMGITDQIPVVFDTNLQPVLFDPNNGGLYMPLLTEETGVIHVLLPELSAYADQGLGVPDSAAMVDVFGFPPSLAAFMEANMIASGLKPSGIPIPGSLTLTASETATIRDAVDGFNTTLNSLAAQFKVPVVDANSMLGVLNSQGLDGYSGKFVLLDPANTAFSLDGVHPNHGGYAIVANAFIQTMNAAFGLSIPTLNTAQYKGQYVSAGITETARISREAVERVKWLFVKPAK